MYPRAFRRCFLLWVGKDHHVDQAFADQIRPERMSVRYENDEATRTSSNFGESTYKTIFDGIEQAGAEV